MNVRLQAYISVSGWHRRLAAALVGVEFLPGDVQRLFSETVLEMGEFISQLEEKLKNPARRHRVGNPSHAAVLPPDMFEGSEQASGAAEKSDGEESRPVKSRRRKSA